MEHKRISLFLGHYGSGKTSLAVNYALMLAKKEKKVAVADLDIVNPYFRTKDSMEVLTRAGIRLIVSEFANTNVDLPAMPAEAYAVLEDRELHAVVDVGGDDRGALALGRYAEAIREENNYEMFFVINGYRPLTRDVESTLEIQKEIESSCGLRFTAIVNNSNLGSATTAQDIRNALPYAEAVSARLGLPIKMTAVHAPLWDALKGEIPDLFPVHLQSRIWDLPNS